MITPFGSCDPVFVSSTLEDVSEGQIRFTQDQIWATEFPINEKFIASGLVDIRFSANMNFAKSGMNPEEVLFPLVELVGA